MARARRLDCVVVRTLVAHLAGLAAERVLVAAIIAVTVDGAVARERLTVAGTVLPIADELDLRVLLRLMAPTPAAVARRRLITPLARETRQVLGELGAL